MSKSEVVISSVGMITAVGNNAEQTAANVRAGTTRYGQVPMAGALGFKYTAAVIPRAGLPPLPEALTNRDFFTRREGLLLSMALVALKNCRENASAQCPPLYLALPEHETTRPLNHGLLLDDLATLAPKSFNRAKSRAEWKGRAGGLLALAEAIRTVQDGAEPFAMVGGVDTFYDPWILPHLDFPDKWRVKSDENGDWAVDSFVPGEGAGFLLIARRPEAAKAGLPALAAVTPFAEGFEPGFWGSTEPYLGEGLSGAVQKLLGETPPPAPIREVYSTMNGESYWAKEWGVARVRSAAAFAEGEQINHPAEYFGDVGAASGPILAGLAAIGISQGYRQSPALVYASSDFGLRAAGFVTALQS